MYKVCIIAAGRGTRMGEFTKHLNKALLPVHGKPAISYVIEKYPQEAEVVIALGYLGDMLRTFLVTAYPERRFTFIDVDNVDGAGSGPGYSLLCCKDVLQCPFILANVDALVTGALPAPEHNWFGVAEVADTSRFSSVAVDAYGNVLRLDDKVKTDNKYAFTGIAGIADYKVFWDALESDTALIAGERQVSNGFQALVRKGMRIVVVDWYDTGVPETYAHARERFPRS